ncbi:hypothetical protein [Aeromonas hydrophila]|uniref:hypothetical protein n=1 Tax=Aeromonas hydrophila TaxID=644 RepID=UPI001F602086|nr:hypothetical protein [Aeromonas hydrophila]UNU27995.1 hypothetical protein GCK65_01955 [Aeromonas hydrophila]
MYILKRISLIIFCLYSSFIFAGTARQADGQVGRIIFVGAILEEPCQFMVSKTELNFGSTSRTLPVQISSCDSTVLSGASFSLSLVNKDGEIYSSKSKFTVENGLSLNAEQSNILALNKTVGVTINYW